MILIAQIELHFLANTIALKIQKGLRFFSDLIAVYDR